MRKELSFGGHFEEIKGIKLKAESTASSSSSSPSSPHAEEKNQVSSPSLPSVKSREKNQVKVKVSSSRPFGHSEETHCGKS